MLVCLIVLYFFFFFFKQKTAYELRISDWSSDVCSSDLPVQTVAFELFPDLRFGPGDTARAVEIVDTQQPDATPRARFQPAGERGHQRAEMQRTARGRGEAAAIAEGRGVNGHGSACKRCAGSQCAARRMVH